MEREVRECIDQGSLTTALFLAERWHAAERSEASLHLVAKCLRLRGQPRCAHEVLRGCTSDANRYLLALCCVDLQLWSEAEVVLSGAAFEWSTARVVNGAHGLALLGSVYQVLLQRERAIACYRAALAINPLLWSAVEGLCALGVEDDPSALLVETPTTPAALSSLSSSSWPVRLQPLARALWQLKSHRCPEALSALALADAPQRSSGWARTLAATALAERGDYVEAVREFDAARRVEPWRLDGSEVHSTALWHLKRDTALAHLAHQCLRLSRTAPQTWCAVGNVMSLLREHDAALRFFARAQQLQPDFVYAYTLCGHEHVANDDLDQAVAQFRLALQHDPRHYKAWYGLGMIYYRTQRMQLAEYHFVQALRIHPRSSALHMYRGMVKTKLRDYDAAMQCLETALACNPRNVLARSLQCQVMIARGELDRGLETVEQMLDVAPREAFLHFLKATVFAKRGERELAIVHYTIAQDLDARNGPLIKGRIDRLQAGGNPLLASGLDVPADNDPEDEFEVM